MKRASGTRQKDRQGRSGSRLARIEHEARQRSVRARSHYARMRDLRVTQRRHRIVLMASFALALAAGIGTGLLRSHAVLDALDAPGRAVSTLSVLGAERLTADEIARASGVQRGSPIAELDSHAVAERIEAHPWIRNASVQRGIGGTIVIRAQERHPAALLQLAGDLEHDTWRAVETDGSAIAAVRPEAYPTLPRLRSADPIAPDSGAAVDARDAPDLRVRDALELARGAERIGLGRPLRIDLPRRAEGGDGWALHFAVDGPTVVLGHDELEARLARYAELRAARPDALIDTVRVDLRFRDRAILRSADGSRSEPRTGDGENAVEAAGEADSPNENQGVPARETAAADSVTPDRLDPARTNLQHQNHERLGEGGRASG